MFKKRRIPRHLILEDSFQEKSSKVGVWIFMVITLGLLSMIAIVSEASINPNVHPQSDRNEGAGQLLMRSLEASDQIEGKIEGQKGEYQPALHLDSEVTFNISGMVAEVSLVQRFHNRSSDWSEAIYVFPLPETAAVNAMEMRLGERVIRAKIKEKQAARKIYQQAKQAGKKASLVEQQRPNMFTQKVANIAPGETIEVSLSYIQKVGYKHGRFSLRFPMTLTPRFIPGRELQAQHQPLADNVQLSDSPQYNQIAMLSASTGWGWALPTDQVPDAHLITPPMLPVPEGQLLNPITIRANLDAGLPLASIDSDYHNLNLRRDGEVHRIELQEKQVSMDRDFVLTWEPVVQKAAQFGRGTFTHVGSEYEVKEKMSALFQQLESPLLGDIALQWPGGDKDNNLIEVWPKRLPDLYRGEPLLFTAKLGQPLQGNLIMRGRVAGSDSEKGVGESSGAEWQQSLSLAGAKQHAGVGNLWARDKIAALMDEKVSGAPETEIKPQVLKVALAHQLVSAYTSFVAVEEKISRPVNKPLNTNLVPNAVAKGQKLMSATLPSNQVKTVSYPRTATLGPTHIALSIVCLALGLLMRLSLRLSLRKSR